MLTIITAIATSLSIAELDCGVVFTARIGHRCNGLITFFGGRGSQNSLNVICSFFRNSSLSIRSKYGVLYLDADLRGISYSIVKVSILQSQYFLRVLSFVQCVDIESIESYCELIYFF